MTSTTFYCENREKLKIDKNIEFVLFVSICKGRKSESLITPKVFELNEISFFA
jgi:hypothetical protein